MALFASDNVSAVCPQVMDAILAANQGDAFSYGEDRWTEDLQARLSEIFEKQVLVFPTVTGTASNALALSALTPPYGKVFCHELSHINTDECAAPEFFTGGAKLVLARGNNGGLTAAGLAEAVRGTGNVHLAQPAAVSITQARETGTVYSLEEIEQIGALAKEKDLALHMDGARFANALASLDCSPAEMTWKRGVEVLSFGGTKNGCLAAEAVVFFNHERAKAFAYLHKRAGQLLSKMRFISAQLLAYVADDLWLTNARHANAMAARLSTGLDGVEGVELVFPVQSNEVFLKLSPAVSAGLEGAGFVVNAEELDGTAVRYVTAWNSDPADVDRLIAAVKR